MYVPGQIADNKMDKHDDRKHAINVRRGGQLNTSRTPKLPGDFTSVSWNCISGLLERVNLEFGHSVTTARPCAGPKTPPALSLNCWCSSYFNHTGHVRLAIFAPFLSSLLLFGVFWYFPTGFPRRGLEFLSRTSRSFQNRINIYPFPARDNGNIHPVHRDESTRAPAVKSRVTY